MLVMSCKTRLSCNTLMANTRLYATDMALQESREVV